MRLVRSRRFQTFTGSATDGGGSNADVSRAAMLATRRLGERRGDLFDVAAGHGGRRGGGFLGRS